ncbi:extracellular solute-binding protein, partial [Gilvimarinus sp. 1_MG-2023]
FDTDKFPGKRGLRKSPKGTLEWALLADGVSKDKVYDVLATKKGLDRAFRQLDAIKQDIIWWESGAQAPQLLADGAVVMTQAYNGRIHDSVKNDGSA